MSCYSRGVTHPRHRSWPRRSIGRRELRVREGVGVSFQSVQLGGMLEPCFPVADTNEGSWCIERLFRRHSRRNPTMSRPCTAAPSCTVCGIHSSKWPSFLITRTAATVGGVSWGVRCSSPSLPLSKAALISSGFGLLASSSDDRAPSGYSVEALGHPLAVAEPADHRDRILANNGPSVKPWVDRSRYCRELIRA